MTPRVEAGTATPYCTPCGLALGAAAGGFGPIPEEVKQQLREMGGERNVIRAQRMVDLINQGIKEGTIKK